MRIVFMGTPDFAVPCLDVLVKNGYNVVGVITVPDKPAGRGKKLKPSPVKVYAEEHGLYLMQPPKLKNPEFLEELRNLKADLQIVVAFRMLPVVVWDMPPIGTFNLHASLLPKYRGAAPINWAIINGEKETGATTFFLQHEIDTGDLLLTDKVAIAPNESAGGLHDKLMHLGADLVLKTVQGIEQNNLTPIPQDLESEQPKAPKIFRDDCRIDWKRPVSELHDFIRGLSPYPAAWTILQGKTFKIYKATPEVEHHDHQAGGIKTDMESYLNIAGADGFMKVEEVQLEGKRRMSIADFLRGYNDGLIIT